MTPNPYTLVRLQRIDVDDDGGERASRVLGEYQTQTDAERAAERTLKPGDLLGIVYTGEIIERIYKFGG